MWRELHIAFGCFEDALRICVESHDCLTASASQRQRELIAVWRVPGAHSSDDDISHFSRRSLAQTLIRHSESNARPSGCVEDDINE